MKSRLLFFIIVSSAVSFSLKAQQLAGSFVNGSLSGSNNGVFGTVGTNSNAHPESLSGHCMWKKDDVIYFFGGEINGSVYGTLTLNNRLWSWDKLNGWKLLDGDLTNATSSSPGTVSYGAKGVASSSNQPGARVGAAYATGPNGELYMYGGYGQSANGWGALGDLWKYDNGMWVWVAGSTTADASPSHVTFGATGSYPGARISANLWVDNNGDVFIFGGGTGTYTQTHDNYHSLMRYNPSDGDWVWVEGSPLVNYSYNAKVDLPVARRNAGGLYASDGNFYLFGGHVSPNGTTTEAQSDFWKFDGSKWTLLSGEPSTNNATSDGREALAFSQLAEINGVIHSFGGKGRIGVSTIATDDVKFFDGTTWSPSTINGSLTLYPEYPMQYREGVPNVSIFLEYTVVSDNKEAYIFGGRSLSSGEANWFLKTNGQSWAYLSGGEQTSTYRAGLSGGPVKPGARGEAAFAYDENNDILYLFGGNAHPETGWRGLSNGLWKLEKGEWTWLSGAKTINGAATYGTLGSANSANTPGARKSAVMWVDESGVLWLFGGEGYDVNSTLGVLNDLWKYQNGAWAWMRGSNTVNQLATTSGSASDLTPAGLYSPAVWKDGSGHAYLFGGIARVGVDTRQNSFWKWDGSNWILLSGTYSSSLGVYGTKGVAASANYPSARSAMAVSGDDNGFFVYGGQGSASSGAFGYLNQLWYYNFSSGHWTWLSGESATVNNQASFGAATDNDVSVDPGNLRSARMWYDGTNLFLFGGYRYNAANATAYLSNNLWHWDGSNWAWLKGGQLGTESTFTATQDANKDLSFKNLPSARASFASWVSNGTFYLWGGLGLSSSGVNNTSLNDFWYFNMGNYWNGSDWSTTRAPKNLVEPVQILSSTAASTIDGGTFTDILVDADNTFNVNNKEVSIAGDVYSYGLWENAKNITFKGGSDQYLYGRELASSGLVKVSVGTNLITNDSLRIVANSASEYGQIYNEGTVTGDLEFEYYLDLPSVTNNGRYFHLGSVLNNIAISDFANGGILNAGGSNAGSNTVWEWDAANAKWSSPASSSITDFGSGYAFYAGHNSYGNFLIADGANPGKVKLRGALRARLIINQIGLGYNDGQGGTVSFVGSGTTAETEGWNLFCNPYPFNIDLASVVSANSDLASALYYWNGSTYASYVSGASTNGGAAVVAPGQGVYIQVVDPNATLSLGLIPSVIKALDSSGVRHKSGSSAPNGLYINANSSGTAKKDQVWLGFNAAANEDFEKSLDAWNMRANQDGLDLFLPTPSGGALSISTLNPDSTNNVPIGFYAPSEHGRQVSFSFELNQLQGFSQLVLEDKKLDYFQDLTADLSYVFVHDTLFQDRFALHFSQSGELTLGETKLVNYYFYQNGEALFVSVIKPQSLPVDVFIYTLSGQLIDQQVWDEGKSIQILKEKPAGVYLLQIGTPQGDQIQSLKVVKK